MVLQIFGAHKIAGLFAQHCQLLPLRRGAYSQRSPKMATGFGDLEMEFWKPNGCCIGLSVYFARNALWLLCAGDLRVCRLFPKFSRFANPRTVATHFLFGDEK